MAMGWKEGSVSGYSDGRELLPGVCQMTINILADCVIRGIGDVPCVTKLELVSVHG